jgi:hypothetical protein
VERINFKRLKYYIKPIRLSESHINLGHFKGLDVYDLSDGLMDEIVVVEPIEMPNGKRRVVAKLEFEPCPEEETVRKVEMVLVQKQYKHQNIAIELYKFLMKTHKLIIEAGSPQTKYGRRLWRKLVDVKGVTLCCVNGRRGKIRWIDREGVELEDEEEIKVEWLDVYKPSVRLFAQWTGQ